MTTFALFSGILLTPCGKTFVVVWCFFRTHAVVINRKSKMESSGPVEAVWKKYPCVFAGFLNLQICLF